jgi:hypothetical protein
MSPIEQLFTMNWALTVVELADLLHLGVRCNLG